MDIITGYSLRRQQDLARAWHGRFGRAARCKGRVVEYAQAEMGELLHGGAVEQAATAELACREAIARGLGIDGVRAEINAMARAIDEIADAETPARAHEFAVIARVVRKVAAGDAEDITRFAIAG